MNAKVYSSRQFSALSKDSTVNVFICYSPFQVYISDMVATELKAKNPENTVNLLVKQSQIQSVYNFEYYHLMRPGMKKLVDIKAARDMFIKISKRFKEVNFFIPHSAGLLSYYVFDKLKRLYPNIKVNMLYEGILYLYEYDYSTHKDNKEIKFRHVASRLLGLNYKFNSNIYPADSAHISSIYTFFPDITLGPKEKMVAIGINAKKYEAKKGRVLLMGQRSSLINQEQHRIVYERMLADLEKAGYAELYYKKHYSDTEDLFSTIAAEKGLKYQTIDPLRPVEELITEYHPELAISMISSALINLKGIFGNSLQLRSYCPKVSGNTTREKVLSNMYEVFVKTGIENVDISF